MPFEALWHRTERELRQKTLFPELRLGDLNSTFGVDRLRRSEGREPTSLGAATESAWIGGEFREPVPGEVATPGDPFLLKGFLNTERATLNPRYAPAGRALLAGLEHADRPRGFLMAAAEEGGALDPAAWRAGIRGFKNPSEYGLGDILERQGVGDKSLWGKARFLPDETSLRDIVGFAGDTILDPLNIVGGGLVKKPLTTAVKAGVRSEAGRGLRTFAISERAALELSPADDAIQKLKNVLITEARLRRGGVPQAEIHAGRRMQAGGIEGALTEGSERGLSGESLALYARGGARTGGLRRTVPEAMDVTPQQRDSLFDVVTGARQAGRIESFDYITATESLQRALNGEGLEPAQRKLLALIFPDLAEALDDGPSLNLGTRGARSAAGRGKFLPGEEPPNLGAGLSLPVGGRYRGVRNEPAGYRQLSARLSAMLEPEPTVTMPFVLGPQRAGRRSRGAPVLPGAVAIPTEGRGLTRWQKGLEAADRRAYEQEKVRGAAVQARLSQLFPTPEAQAARAKNLGGSERVVGIIERWERGTQAYLDNIGTETGMLGRFVEGKLKGHTNNQFINAALFQRNILRDVLTAEGLPEKVVQQVSNDMFYSQIAKRYPGDLPPAIAEILTQVKSPPYSESLGGVSMRVQQAKNLRFGLDFAVAGQQGLAAWNRGGAQIILGVVNELFGGLHSPLLRAAYSGDAQFSKRLAFALDGVEQGLGSSVVQNQAQIGSALRWLPGIGKHIDAPWVKMTDYLTKVQYGTVLSGIRNLAHEGQLVSLKIAGRDITDPAVRKMSANWANAVGSYGGVALNPKRATAESLVRTSAAMTRSQVAHVVNLSKLIAPTASIENRILAAMGVLSSVTGPLLTVAFLDSVIGVEDTQLDPLKPGFGQVTLDGGRVVDVFPQDSVVNAIGKSVSALKNEDPAQVAKLWAQFVSAGGSDLVRIGGAALQTGYDTEGRFRYGDLSLGDAAAGMLPIPPNVLDVAATGFDSVDQAAGFFGVNTFQESAFAEAQRLTDDKYKDYSPKAKVQFAATHRDLAARLSQETIEQGGTAGRREEVTAGNLQKQAAIDAAYESGDIDIGKWEDATHDLTIATRATKAEIMREVAKEPHKVAIVEAYFRAIETAERPWGVDWRQFHKWENKLRPQEQAILDQYIGVGGTPFQKERRAVARELEQVGFFDLRDQVWEAVRQDPRYANVRAFESVDELESTRRRELRQQGYTAAQVEILTEQWMDKVPAVTKWRETANRYEEQFIRGNPALAARAVAYGYLGAEVLRKRERRAILAVDE